MFGLWRLRQWREERRAQARLAAAQAAVAAFPSQTRQRPHGLPAPLVVTLTSYPPRFGTLAPTLKSLLDQNVAADVTVLWIAHDDLPLLPPSVLALQDHGLLIRGCDDLRSYKKLIPARTAFPGHFFVTADDDAYYPPDWLDSLVSAFDPADPAVIAGRKHLAFLDSNGHLRPYADWVFASHLPRATDPNTRLFPTGVGGVLYPPAAFVTDVDDIDAFMATCPAGDDIWFFWMSRRAGMDQRAALRPFAHVCWPSTQGVALANENVEMGRNDAQIRAMEARYGPVP